MPPRHPLSASASLFALALAPALALALAPAPALALGPALAVNCDGLPGAWSGYEGGALVDHYVVDWRPEGGAGAFWVNTTAATHEPWTYALCGLAPSNLSATCFFPQLNAWLAGPASFGCRSFAWNNTSTFTKDTNVTKVHLLFMSHLDVGFTGLINAAHNSYVTTHYPRALALAAAMRANASSSGDRFSYTTHPWLLSLFFDCPADFVLSGLALLCPNATQVAEMREAVQRGDIQFHAAPFNVEWEGVNEPEFALTYFALAKNLSTLLGVPAPRTASTRDVPGVTRGLLPVLAAAGVTRFSEGCNGATLPPQMPSPSVWRDEASGAQVLYVQHSWGYGRAGGGGADARARARSRNPLRSELGDAQCAAVPGFGEVLCFNFRGEGAGPPDNVQEVKDTFAAFRAEFPGAAVVSSSFDAFFDALEQVSDSLPVVTSENGDSWINGYAGDPAKMGLFRTISTAYSECVRARQCDLSDPRLAAFARFALKSPEHTWGLGPIDQEAQFVWANEDFHAALKPGGIQEFLDHASSFEEQRNVTAVYALAALADHPLASTIAQRVAEAAPAVPAPGPDYLLVPRAQWTDALSVALPGGGAVSLAIDGAAGGLALLRINGSANLANPARPLAALVYRQFNGSDWGAASTCPLAYRRYGDDAAGAMSYSTRASMDALYVQQGAGPRSFLVHATLPPLLVLEVGAPQDVWLNVTVDFAGDLHVDVQLFGKTSTRFGEALLLEWLFAPGAVPAPADGRWLMDKLGSVVDPLDGVAAGSTQQHGVGSGVFWTSPSGGRAGGGLFLDTLDAPVMAPAVGAEQAYTSLPLSPAPLVGPVTGWTSVLFTNASTPMTGAGTRGLRCQVRERAAINAR